MNTALPIMVRLVVFLGLSWMVAGAAADGDDNKGYRIQPGDVLHIDVWHEEELQRETLVRPDGGISFPLVGDINAEGRTAVALTAEITEKLVRFIPDPVVTVTVAQAAGNRLYVLGEVARPGEFAMSRPVNVLQALAMAGGLTPYADRDSIQVLREAAISRRPCRSTMPMWPVAGPWNKISSCNPAT